MRWFVLSLGLVLAACGGPTPYQPSTNGEGFSEQRLEADRFRVQVAGNSLTPREMVQDQLLFRAAELTLGNGYDRFVMVAQGTEPHTDYYHYPVDPFPGWVGRRSRYFFPPRYESEAVVSYDTWAEIKMYKGAGPGGSNVYDARNVVDELRGRVLAPKPG